MTDKRPVIVIMYGPPCAGKSTLSGLLVKDTGFKFLSTDSLRISYFKELRELYSSASVVTIYKMLFERIEKNIADKKSLIVEGMFLTKEYKLKALQYANEADLKFIYVTADFNTLALRLNYRNKKGSNNILQQQVPLSLNALKNFYDVSLPPAINDLVIDTGKLDITQCLKKIKSVIAKDYSLDFLSNTIINEANY